MELFGPDEPGPKMRELVEHCVICLDDISDCAVLVPCSHDAFDSLCALKWLLDHDSKCPLCKVQVTAVLYDIKSTTSYQNFQIPRSLAPTSSSHQGSSNAQDSQGSREHRWRRRSPSPGPRHDAGLQQRKHIYRHQLYSLHIGANDISGHRNFTPGEFERSSQLQSRARKWLRRELRVFAFLDPSYSESVSFASDFSTMGRKRQANNPEFLLEYIIAMLRKLEIKDANGKAEQILAEFLGRDNARLLLHELEAWLRSPYQNVGQWDAIVQYHSIEDIPANSNQPAVGEHKGLRN